MTARRRGLAAISEKSLGTWEHGNIFFSRFLKFPDFQLIFLFEKLRKFAFSKVPPLIFPRKSAILSLSLTLSGLYKGYHASQSPMGGLRKSKDRHLVGSRHRRDPTLILRIPDWHDWHSRTSSARHQEIADFRGKIKWGGL